MPITIGIYIYDNVEVLDFSGPFEVFCTASRMKTRLDPGSEIPFQVHLIADRLRPIQARGGLTVHPHYSLDNHPALDVLLVPGGIHTQEMERNEIIDWIVKIAKTSRMVASVCTGSFLLAKAGLLDGHKVTTHWEDIPDLRAFSNKFTVLENTRWVDNERVITSAGISAGIDMALHIVARLESEVLAVRTACQMEFDWNQKGTGTQGEKMPLTLAIFSGLPGVGKTTLAEAVTRQLNLPLLRLDDFAEAIPPSKLDHLDPQAGFHYWTEIVEILLNLAESQLRRGSLVIDAVFMGADRFQAQEAARHCGAGFRPIYIFIANETLWKLRVEKRKQESVFDGVADWAQIQHQRQYFWDWQPGTALFVDGSESIEGNVAKICEFIGDPQAGLIPLHPGLHGQLHP